MTSTALLNTDYGLAACQHKKTLYQSILQGFYQQHQPLLQRSSLNAAEAQELAHSLKSTAPLCGALALASIASLLTPPAPPPTARQCRQLLELAQQTLQQIETEYNNTETLPGERQGERSATGLGTLTHQLLQKLEQHNLSAVPLFNSWASTDAAHWPDEHLAAISQALQAFSFEHAKQLVIDGLAGEQKKIKPTNAR